MTSQYGSRGPTGRVAGHRIESMQQYTPEQMQLFQSLFSHAGPGSYLSRLAGGDQGAFEQMEAPSMRQFAGLQGDLASRFSGMGLGARRSSGFQNTATQASSDFAQQLLSRRHELQRQAIQDLRGLSSDLLGYSPYEQFGYEKQHQPFWQKLLGGALPLVGAGAGALLGGPGGALAGGKIGSAAGQAFF